MIKGVIFSVSASLLFGVIYYLSTVLQPMSGEALLGWRILVTLPFLFVLLYLIKQHNVFLQFIVQLKNQPYLLLVLLVTSASMGVQMWLFLWAPVNNRAIEVSMGYLLMPLIMVLIGRFLYRERISKIKAYAILFATVGVLSKIILSGSFYWESILACLGYPLYFVIRRQFNILHFSSFVVEMILLLPISFYFANQVDMAWVQTQNSNIYLWLAVLGIVGAVALGVYVLASQTLPMNLFGLLSYLEPVTMFTVSFLIGERLANDSYLLMICLFIAIILLVLDGSFRVWQKPKMNIL
ncbi:EamA family transporter RarD [Lonepinella koalarum]|nr:EamA family transporter RarD [Lonepinella koalarum]MDH2926966.1 permease [Lonepinella koalarum]TFJ89332.1 EamA family transporter RarD [Lonepinella koalarum]TYG35571.1 EamA family transporter RarD [Lonepinella koalarum]